MSTIFEQGNGKIINFLSSKVFHFFVIVIQKENVTLFVLQQFKKRKIIKNVSFKNVSILHSWNINL